MILRSNDGPAPDALRLPIRCLLISLDTRLALVNLENNFPAKSKLIHRLWR
jgi:hypothetical protein